MTRTEQLNEVYLFYRSFPSSSLIQSLYDWVDVSLADASSGAEVPHYRLVATMPKKIFDQKHQSLEEAGLENMTVLLVEKC